MRTASTLGEQTSEKLRKGFSHLDCRNGYPWCVVVSLLQLFRTMLTPRHSSCPVTARFQRATWLSRHRSPQRIITTTCKITVPPLPVHLVYVKGQVWTVVTELSVTRPGLIRAGTCSLLRPCVVQELAFVRLSYTHNHFSLS